MAFFIPQKGIRINTMIKTFDFNSNPVRITIVSNNIVLFVAKDVAETLGYKRSSDAIKQHCKKAQSLSAMAYGDLQGLGLHPSLLLIPESDVYRLVMRSKLPSAEAFQDWVLEDVLPTIRRYGAYVPNFKKPAEAAKAFIEQFDRAELAIATKAEIGCRREATAMNTASQAVKNLAHLERKVELAKNYYTIEQMSILHPHLGYFFNLVTLRKYAYSMSIEPKKVFNLKYKHFYAFHLDVWKTAYDVDGADYLFEL